ncbi:MAG TPA: DUF1223 domain-containing protein [Candidatus Sulfotelmatobacter sp.]|jgi:hypothetical protein|nr:DUF1223 domain-containing protein [Candidatus Sulfotelmatobacter sp.]
MRSKLLQSPLFYATAVAVVAFLVLSSFGRSTGVAAPRDPGNPPHLVIVELFTSEGCSSCPPADALLKELSEQQKMSGVQVVALEEHVDYWDHLGWKDPYSAAEFSQRQSDYAQVFGTDGVYTPQMIVDGQSELVGSRSRAAREAIQKAANQPKAEIVLNAGANSSPGKPTFEVRIKSPEGISVRGETELWLAVTEKGLQTDVKAGENSGETLKHAAVVRSLRKIETLRDPAGYFRQVQIAVDPGWKKENLAVVVFVVEKSSRKIIGAAVTPLNSITAAN